MDIFYENSKNIILWLYQNPFLMWMSMLTAVTVPNMWVLPWPMAEKVKIGYWVIMHLFDELWCWFPIASAAMPQYTLCLKRNSSEKYFSSHHILSWWMDGQTKGQMDQQHHTIRFRSIIECMCNLPMYWVYVLSYIVLFIAWSEMT